MSTANEWTDADEIAELESAIEAFEAENAKLKAELKKFEGMRLEWERGGFAEVIEGRDFRLRVAARQLEVESFQKVRNLNSMNYWKKQAIRLGWKNPNHAVIPLDGKGRK